MKLKHFALARKASLKSDHPCHRLGAVVARGNKVVSIGWNRYKTHPHSPHPFKHIHAEVAALMKITDKLDGADLYIYREGKDGIPRLSKPCKSCMNVIKQAGIKRIYYTDFGYRSEMVDTA